MKNFIITSIIALLVAGWSVAGAQNYPDEYLGLPGDNLNLYAVMKLFQESETLEGFERSLNDENSMINNLDLNGDNLVDYLMVFDYVDKNVHTIVLRVALDQTETQDVAVFTVERFRDGSVQVQLVGDELLYGKNYIIEPVYADSGETPNPGYMGNSAGSRRVTVVQTTTYQVAEWPLIRFIFLPSYVSWHSSWYWGYRPVYWNPWRPVYWHTYYGYHNHWHHHYYAHYRHWNHYRYPRYKNHYYTNIRTYSPRVTVNINAGRYRTTYSRPDLRREGEVLARKNSRRNSGTVKTSSLTRVRTSAATTVQRSRSTAGPGAERRSTGSSVNKRTVAPRKSATVRSSREPQNLSGNNSRTVRSSSSNNSRSSTVTRPARSGSVQKSANVSGSRSSVRSPVRRGTGSNQRSAPSVSRRSVPQTKSASGVSPSRSSSRQSSSSVSRRSSGSRSRAAAPARSSESSSSRRSGRR